MRKFILTIAAIITFIPAAHAKTVVDVNGMVCDFCAQALEKVFGKEEAVENIEVDLGTQTVTIYYKDGMEPLSDDVINKAVYWAGYDVVAIKHEDG